MQKFIKKIKAHFTKENLLRFLFKIQNHLLDRLRTLVLKTVIENQDYLQKEV